MKFNVKNILILILMGVIAYFFLFVATKGRNTHSSSLIIEEVHDTIPFWDTVKVKELVPYAVYETKTDTFLSEGNYSVKKFEYKINDSLLDGTIVATSPFKPKIDFKYNVKSFNIKDSIVVQPPTDFSGWFYGGSMVVKPFATELFLDGAKSFENGNQINLSIGRNFEAKYTVFKVGVLRKF